MKIDFTESPELAGRYAVIDVDTGEEVTRIAWADEESDAYATFIVRPRKLSDPPDVDLRLRNPDGTFALREHRGEVQIVDVTEPALKPEILLLLDDPDVAEKIARIVAARYAIRGPLVDRKAVAEEVERVLGRMAAARA